MVTKICKEFSQSFSCLSYTKPKASHIPSVLNSFEKCVRGILPFCLWNIISSKYNSSLTNAQIYKHYIYIQITNSLCKIFLVQLIPNIHYLFTSFYKKRWKLHTSLISKFNSILMMSTDFISSTPAVEVSWEICTSCFNVEISSGSLISPKDV